jgi:hypothetical protein
VLKASVQMQNGKLEINLSTSNSMYAPFGIMIPEGLVSMMQGRQH